MVLLALALVATASGVITVDDDGPADYFNVPAGIAAAAPGDTLLIWPGTYQSVATSKPLSMVGAVPGQRPDLRMEFTVDSVSSYTFAGLELCELQVSNVTGRVRLDDCVITGATEVGAYGTCVFEACPDVVITRCVIEYQAPFWIGYGHEAMKVTDSGVTLAGCTVTGPDGEDDSLWPDWGYEAIRTFGVVELRVIGCDVFGGDGGEGLWPAGGVPAIVEWDGSLDLVIRGSSIHRVSGGNEAAAVNVGGGYTWSGVRLESHAGEDPLPVSPAEPCLLIGGRELGPRRLKLYGALGDTALVVVSLGPAHFDPPGFAGDLVLLDPNLAVVLIGVRLLGQDTVAAARLELPSGLEVVGVELDVQAVVWRPGDVFVTNAHQLVLLN